MFTKHAKIRNQQRCIPPIIHDWLDQYGDEIFDGHGYIKVFFSKKSIKIMAKEFGSNFVQSNRKYLNLYRIEASSTGLVITNGWKTKRIKN